MKTPWLAWEGGLKGCKGHTSVPYIVEKVQIFRFVSESTVKEIGFEM